MSFWKSYGWLARISVVSCFCIFLYSRRYSSLFLTDDGMNFDGGDIGRRTSDGDALRRTRARGGAMVPAQRVKRELEWTTMAMLGDVLERIAVDRKVIICTVNSPYWKLFLNWLISLERVGLADRLLVFAGDAASWHFLEQHWPGHVVLFRFPGRDDVIKETDPELWYGKDDYGKRVGMRPAQILVCLEHGYDVLYSDIDSVFLRDPLPYFVGDFQIGFAWDGYLKPAWMDGGNRLPYKRNLHFCTALIYCRPSQQAMELLHRWMLRLRQTNMPKNQPAFNEVLDEIRKANDTFYKFLVLPITFFPSGYIMLNETREWRAKGGRDPAVVHMNFHYGNEEKIKAFKRHNLWFLNESDDGTIEWPLSLTSGRRKR